MTLEQFFAENREVAIAFSGGVDSAYLLYAATRYAARVKAYYVSTAFQPEFELADARRLADELGADMQVLHVDVLMQRRGHGEPARPLLSLQKYAVPANPPGGGKRRLPGAAGRHQRLRRRGRPAGNAGAAGAVGSLSPPGVRPDQGGDPPSFQRSRAVHMGQARLRLPRHPDTHRGGNHAAKAEANGKGRRASHSGLGSGISVSAWWTTPQSWSCGRPICPCFWKTGRKS